MSEFSDRLDEWQKLPEKPADKPPPLPGRPLVQRLDTMANMFTYGFWGWEYEEETKQLLLEAAKVIESYEDLLMKVEEQDYNP